MPDWTTFAGVAGVVLVLLLVLARLTESQLTDGSTESDAATPRTSPVSPGYSTDSSLDGAYWDPDAAAVASSNASRRGDPSIADLPAPALLANVALSQGLFGVVLAVAAWWTEIPMYALGLAPAFTPQLLGLGIAFGATLWLGNELAGRVGARFGLEGGEQLRALLAPDTFLGWALLLFAVLPLVALFEEFLFRAVLIGALGAGFAVAPWLLVVGSSVAFALGHGAQGRAGIAVTGALGLVLGAAFALTGSLLVVVVAHYLVNALEFVVHEGFGMGE